MTRASDVTQMIRRAQADGLKAVREGDRWIVTNPQTGVSQPIPLRLTGQALHNYRSRLRRLGTVMPTDGLGLPSVTVDPVPAPKPAGDLPRREWTPLELLAEAERQGVKVSVRGGLLHVVCPLGLESIGDVLRSREADIVAALRPPSEQKEPDVAKIRDTARISGDKPADVATSAYVLWGTIRERAGDVSPEQIDGTPGVRWRGAMSAVISELWPTMAEQDRIAIGQFLRSSGNATHIKLGGEAYWWVAAEWRDEDVRPRGFAAPRTKARATPLDVGKGHPPAKVTVTRKPVEPAVSEPAGAAYAFLQAMDARIAEAEQRADVAESRLAEVEAERDEALARAEKAEAELETINAMFARFGGGR